MNRLPAVLFVAFLATIPLANWTLDRYGFISVPVLGPVAAGVVWVGVAFVLRDALQAVTNDWLPLVAVALGVGISWWLANPQLAVASACAFGLSELLDWSIYTPMARRNLFYAGVIASSLVGGMLDSALFLHLAFHSTRGWWQLAVAKGCIVLAVTPLAVFVRRQATNQRPQVAVAQ